MADLFHIILLLSTLTSVSLPMVTEAGDPDLTSDFLAPANKAVSAEFFTFTGFRGLLTAPTPAAFKVTKASLVEFPALNGQSVSYAFLQYPPGSVNPPHTHPRAAELLFVVEGQLEVGLIDTTNKLFTQMLQKGDLFVFPKGLVHFQYNSDPKNCAIAISSFGSANAGTISIPATIFTTGIKDLVLAKSFKTDVSTVQKLKAGLVPKA